MNKTELLNSIIIQGAMIMIEPIRIFVEGETTKTGYKLLDVKLSDSQKVIEIHYQLYNSTTPGFNVMRIAFASDYVMEHVFVSDTYYNFGDANQGQKEQVNLQRAFNIAEYVVNELNTYLDWAADNIEPEHSYE